MKEIIIWTDGSSSGNDFGPGGYAAVICIGKDEILIGGGCSRTTNQKMELMAAITALEYLTEPTRVTLHTDSSYVSNCFLQGWWERWLTNGWRDSKKKPVKNRVLWERLMRLNEFHEVMWCKVKGHSADFPMNERCDRLAAAQKMLHSSETRVARTARADLSAPAATDPRPPRSGVEVLVRQRAARPPAGHADFVGLRVGGSARAGRVPPPRRAPHRLHPPRPTGRARAATLEEAQKKKPQRRWCTQWSLRWSLIARNRSPRAKSLLS